MKRERLVKYKIYTVYTSIQQTLPVVLVACIGGSTWPCMCAYNKSDMAHPGDKWGKQTNGWRNKSWQTPLRYHKSKTPPLCWRRRLSLGIIPNGHMDVVSMGILPCIVSCIILGYSKKSPGHPPNGAVLVIVTWWNSFTSTIYKAKQQSNYRNGCRTFWTGWIITISAVTILHRRRRHHRHRYHHHPKCPFSYYYISVDMEKPDIIAWVAIIQIIIQKAILVRIAVITGMK